MKQQTYVIENSREVLGFLKSRFSMFHQSNFFFRDIQYGIMTFLEKKGMKTGYPAAEKIARAFAEKLEAEGIFIPVDRQSWVVNYPEYRKPQVKPAAPAKKPVPA
jgi:hypothetical protein